jgi:hypothetical protein
MTFDTFSGLEQPERVQQLIEKGSAITEMIDTLVKRATRRAVRRKWMGYNVLVVNSTFWMSEVGNELAQGADIGICWLQTPTNHLEVSLRSNSDNVDVVRLHLLSIIYLLTQIEHYCAAVWWRWTSARERFPLEGRHRVPYELQALILLIVAPMVRDERRESLLQLNPS